MNLKIIISFLKAWDIYPVAQQTIIIIKHIIVAKEHYLH